MVHSYALRPAWTPLTIALMVIGFIVFWPLGLVMLAYIIWGHRVPELRRHFEGMRNDFRSESRDRSWGCGPSRGGFARSGNVAFDEYRAREMKRLEEERRRLDDERREFETFMQNLRRARDQEEFERFMQDRRAMKPGDEDKAIDL